MGRRIFRTVVVAACVGVAVLWARSYRRADAVAVYGSPVRLNAIGSARGSLIFFGSNTPVDPQVLLKIAAGSIPLEQAEMPVDSLFERIRFTIFGGRMSRAQVRHEWNAGPFRIAGGDLDLRVKPSPKYVAAAIPHWFVLGVTGLPSALWVRGAIRRRRWARDGRCPSCGYDLRSTPDRCPECGKPVSPSPAATMSVGVGVAFCLLLLPAPAGAKAPGRDMSPSTQRLKDVDIRQTTLETAFDLLRDMTGANIVVCWPTLEQEGISRSAGVSVRLSNVRLGTVLSVILESVGDDTADLDWVEDRGVITVSSRVDLARSHTSTVYDVRDLVAMILAGTPQSAADQRSPWAKCVDDVVQVVTESVDPDSWRDAGGAAGFIENLGGRLVVRQTPANQEKVRRLLDDLRREFARPAVARPATVPVGNDQSPPGMTRFYDVRELISAIRGASAEQPEAETWFEAGAELVGYVVDNIEPETWSQTGPMRPHIAMIGGRLVVTQTPEVHALIEQFLIEFRREMIGGGKEEPQR